MSLSATKCPTSPPLYLPLTLLHSNLHTTNTRDNSDDRMPERADRQEESNDEPRPEESIVVGFHIFQIHSLMVVRAPPEGSTAQSLPTVPHRRLPHREAAAKEFMQLYL